MKRTPILRLVVDADVLCAASYSADEVPSACREFLLAIFDICHHIVIAGQLSSELDDHISQFSFNWRVQMESRGKVDYISSARVPTLQTSIETRVAEGDMRSALLKDMHLLEAAIGTDRRIVSRDDCARGGYAELSKANKRICDVLWVNPCDGASLQWLTNGARIETKHTLGHKPRRSKT